MSSCSFIQIVRMDDLNNMPKRTEVFRYSNHSIISMVKNILKTRNGSTMLPDFAFYLKVSDRHHPPLFVLLSPMKVTIYHKAQVLKTIPVSPSKTETEASDQVQNILKNIFNCLEATPTQKA